MSSHSETQKDAQLNAQKAAQNETQKEEMQKETTDVKGHKQKPNRNHEQTHQSSSEHWFFNGFAFLSLTDTEVLKECGKYDRTIVYAMVFRQLVTFVFTSLLFIYGVSMFLETIPAVVVGIIFALTLFFLDQAIIGSDWALKNPFKSGLPLRSLFGLIPRIIYSLIIAIGLATLAEISLQTNAIDEQIQQESNEKNKDYFTKLEKYEQELETGITIDREKIDDLQKQLQRLREQRNRFELSSTENDNDTLSNSLAIKQTNVSELHRSQQVLIAEIANINERIVSARKDYDFWFNEALQERTGRDGRAPTEGPKYRRAVATYTDLNKQIENLETNLTDVQAKLDALKPNIASATNELNQIQKEKNDLILNDKSYHQNKLDSEQLEQRLHLAKTELNLAIETKQKRLEEFRTKLEKDGLFYETKTGVLRRYLALKSIHRDAEVGEAATLFSLLLKIFLIAIELMPVFIKLFFSPFSFYSLKMHCKMQVALLEEQEKLNLAKARFRTAEG